jgi:hypothetical protein
MNRHMEQLVSAQKAESVSLVPDERSASGDADHPAQHPEQCAGQDGNLRRRLKEDPADQDAQLDVALDETMDASDPPANTQPGHDQPVPSSGYKQ